MKYFSSFIWPLLVIIGVVLFWLSTEFDNEMSSSIFSYCVWLIPVGVIGHVVDGYSQHRPIRTSFTLASWILVAVSMLGLYNSWFTTGLNVLGWIIPILGFAAIGLILMIISAILNTIRLKRLSSTAASRISDGTPRH